MHLYLHIKATLKFPESQSLCEHKFLSDFVFFVVFLAETGTGTGGFLDALFLFIFILVIIFTNSFLSFMSPFVKLCFFSLSPLSRHLRCVQFYSGWFWIIPFYIPTSPILTDCLSSGWELKHENICSQAILWAMEII